MPQSTEHTPESLMDAALASEKGIRVDCGSEELAVAIRMGCYSRRRRDRHGGASLWDTLKITVDGRFLLFSHPPKLEVTSL